MDHESDLEGVAAHPFKPGRAQCWMDDGDQNVGYPLQAIYFVMLARLLGALEYGIFAGAFAFVNLVGKYSQLGVDQRRTAALPHGALNEGGCAQSLLEPVADPYAQLARRRLSSLARDRALCAMNWGMLKILVVRARRKASYQSVTRLKIESMSKARIMLRLWKGSAKGQ